jgi:AcrR family transcriptional regulator
MEMGYERASMADIAKRAKTTKPTLYGYFPAKADLFMSAIIHCFGDSVVQAYAAPPSRASEDPRLVLTDFGEQHVAVVASPQAAAFKRLIVGTMTERADAERFWELGSKGVVETIERYLVAATEAGKLKVENPKVAAQQLLSLYEAEITWGGPIGVPLELSPEMIREVTARAVNVFIAVFGV